MAVITEQVLCRKGGGLCSLHVSPKWQLLQKRFFGGFCQLFFTFVSQLPFGAKVARSADMSHPYPSTLQQTIHRVITFLGLLDPC